MPAPVCRAWRKPHPAGGRKSERRLKPPLPLLRLRRQQLRRTRLRLRTTSGATLSSQMVPKLKKIQYGRLTTRLKALTNLLSNSTS